MRFIVFVLAVAALATLGATAQSGSPSFTLDLSTKKSEFRAGDKVWIKVTQINISNHQISCSYIGGNGVNTQYRCQVLDEDGKTAEKVKWDVPPAGNLQCEIAPGESDNNSLCLSNVFKLDRPGKYTIQVWRFDPDVKDDEGNALKVQSNIITITITG